MAYDLDTFTEQAGAAAQDRPFDRYILPGFLVWYAWASRKPMGRWTRRMLFTAGVYAVYRNLAAYRDALRQARAALVPMEQNV
jgi:hypothetical protein